MIPQTNPSNPIQQGRQARFMLGMSIFIGVLALLAICGCRTVQVVSNDASGHPVTNTVQQLDPERTSNILRAIISPATRIAIAKNPDVRKYLEAAKVATCSLADAGRVSPADLQSTVDATGINEINTPETQATIASVYAIYQAYYSDVVRQQLNVNEWVLPVLRAICDGLEAGLTPPPATSSDNGKNLGVYYGMNAIGYSDGNVAMINGNNIQTLRYITAQEFVDVYVLKLKPEYSR